MIQTSHLHPAPNYDQTIIIKKANGKGIGKDFAGTWMGDRSCVVLLG